MAGRNPPQKALQPGSQMEPPKILYEETTINFNRMEERRFWLLRGGSISNLRRSPAYEEPSDYSFLR
jgi:hypothetical protein